MHQPPQFLHPVALRSQTSAAGDGSHSVAVQHAAHQTSLQIRASTTANSQEAEGDVINKPRPATPVSSTSCATSEARVYGLQHPAGQTYHVHPDNAQIKLLTARQYNDLQAQDLALNTPEHVVFPWLHGADQRGTAQAMYFGYNDTVCKTPRFRALTTVCADSERPFSRPHSRLSSLNSLSAASYDSASSISSFTSSSSSACSFASTDDSTSDDDCSFDRQSPSGSSDQHGPEHRPAQLLSSFWPDELLFYDKFQQPHVPPQINLRNFRLQATKMASVSDIVIYAYEGIESLDILSVAERFLAAQQEIRKQRIHNGDDPNDLVEYDVFIVVDRFDVFERRFPSLVAVTSNGYRQNKVDFFEREREEMRILTQASPIADGVWLGNTQDVPLVQRNRQRINTELDDLAAALDHPSFDLRFGSKDPSPSGLSQGSRARMMSSDSSSSLGRDDIDDGNPHRFSICIEAHDQAMMPSNDTLKQYDAVLDRTAQMAKNAAQKSPRNFLDTQSGIDPAHIVHLECISTGQACAQPGSTVAFIEGLVHMVMWIRRQVKPSVSCASPAATPTSSFPSNPLLSRRKRQEKQQLQSQQQVQREPRNVLIHTADGYTDTSVIALAYIMYDRACTLPQAYLHLQNDRNRSFFVYPADIALLGRLETRLLAIIAEERRLATDLTTVNNASNDMDLDVPQPAPAPTGMFKGRFSRSSTPVNSSTSQPPAAPLTLVKPMSATEKLIAAPFFYNDRFDGSFPSRILPFLYLGNLNHATNALMLKELGITHVVSIGESALVPPRSPCTSPLGIPTNAKPRIPTNSLWLEHSLGNIDVLDLKGISDDGIDPIRGYLEESEAFIERARQSGGKVLVHCRVGVSRSASLVIAYTMKHLEMDLQSAYLLVRSRRLNILIQPTVLFMWSLQWYEAKLNQERAARGQRKLGARLAWGYLAQSLTELNKRYLSC